MAVDPFLGTKAQKSFIATSPYTCFSLTCAVGLILIFLPPAVVVQAIVVLVMISITFRLVAEHVDFSSTSYYKVLVPGLLVRSSGAYALPDPTMLYGPVPAGRVRIRMLFELAMAFDALRLRNVIQLVGILVFHAALIVFAALQVHETRTALVRLQDCDGSVDFVKCGGPHTLFRKVEPFLVVVPCIIALAWLVLLWFVKALYAEFGWAIFRVVGANPATKTMYQFYQIMICLLKFDFFCFTGVTIQLLIIVLSSSSAEFGLTVTAIPVVLVLLFGCGVAVQREIRWMMISSLVLMLAAETYLYKLVRFFEPSSEAQYETTRATLTTFTIVAFLLLLATFGIGLRCLNDFGKGLVSSKTYDAPLFRRKRGSNANSEPKEDGGELEPRLSIE
ncbi:hypothetical protein HETIRDRAFT_424995 [Heterobasidion irregulare TC 32-1]|uniref:TRP C-terminal domain-containing protein n=1 Tax=Heterobasidion irregulare (strain TC 32-1) TaxID=747525 RepID=W4KLL7_HETIT|nr:uncharacterized protein HETIRDRAFT_424995 [Heterobasidion irregulare TC 32-1]ETW85941.1 hypothetical protein HETIRDRAFT_424995 [Heterobasidion irregulare TC 32-1]